MLQNRIEMKWIEVEHKKRRKKTSWLFTRSSNSFFLLSWLTTHLSSLTFALKQITFPLFDIVAITQLLIQLSCFCCWLGFIHRICLFLVRSHFVVRFVLLIRQTVAIALLNAFTRLGTRTPLTPATPTCIRELSSKVRIYILKCAEESGVVKAIQTQSMLLKWKIRIHWGASQIFAVPRSANLSIRSLSSFRFRFYEGKIFWIHIFASLLSANIKNGIRKGAQQPLGEWI